MKSVILKKIVLIGASTGGPGQIQKIIKSLPQLQGSTIVIAQHMVKGFLDSFATQLQTSTPNKISVILEGEVIQANQIYIAECVTFLDTTKLSFHKEKISHNTYNPNIDRLFESFVPLSKKFEILCVILTGIGSDGVNAAIALSNKGVTCITESEKSAIVDGMPNKARALVPNVKVDDINGIINTIKEFCDV